MHNAYCEHYRLDTFLIHQLQFCERLELIWFHVSFEKQTLHFLIKSVEAYELQFFNTVPWQQDTLRYLEKSDTELYRNYRRRVLMSQQRNWVCKCFWVYMTSSLSEAFAHHSFQMKSDATISRQKMEPYKFASLAKFLALSKTEKRSVLRTTET